MATLGGKNGCRLQGTGRLLDWSKNNRKARHWDFDYWLHNRGGRLTDGHLGGSQVFTNTLAIERELEKET